LFLGLRVPVVTDEGNKFVEGERAAFSITRISHYY
jgi:hypothetical protein